MAMAVVIRSCMGSSSRYDCATNPKYTGTGPSLRSAYRLSIQLATGAGDDGRSSDAAISLSPKQPYYRTRKRSRKSISVPRSIFVSAFITIPGARHGLRPASATVRALPGCCCLATLTEVFHRLVVAEVVGGRALLLP